MLRQEFSSAGEVTKEVGVWVPLMLIAQPWLKGPLNAQLKQALQRQLRQCSVPQHLPCLSREYPCDCWQALQYAKM